MQSIDAPVESKNCLITSKVITEFFDSLCTLIACVFFSRPNEDSRLKEMTGCGFACLWFVVLTILISGCRSESVELEITGLQDGDPSLSARLFQPSGEGPFPAVVLLHGCSGVLSKHVSWAKWLVEQGFVAVVVDSFASRGLEKICDAEDRVWKRFETLRPLDAQAAFRYLESQAVVDSSRIALMGWSNGGTIALGLNERSLKPAGTHFKAVIGIYPSCWQFQLNNPRDQYRFEAPLLLAYGAEDSWTKPRHCDDLIAALSPVSVIPALKMYPNAFHDFDNPRQQLKQLYSVRIEQEQSWGDVKIGYNRQAHLQLQQDVKKFFAEHL